jgi:DNA modification methylase
MPESVEDRPTSSYEMVFLLAKAGRYFYDAEAIAEPFADERMGNPGAYQRTTAAAKGQNNDRQDGGFLNNGGGWNADGAATTRNARNVWAIATQPYAGAHFATMPPDLAERCIKAGSRPGDTILDPFGGAGTTALVADRLQRHAILCELNPEYARLARERLTADAPLFAEVAA